MTRIDELPADQRAVILERLGKDVIKRIEQEVGDDVRDVPPIARGDLVRGHPRKSYPISRFYWACLRMMGAMPERSRTSPRLPFPAMAWLELLKQRDRADPSFSHPAFAETVTYFGGWATMWAEFNKLEEHVARNRFVMTFKEISGQ